LLAVMGLGCGCRPPSSTRSPQPPGRVGVAPVAPDAAVAVVSEARDGGVCAGVPPAPPEPPPTTVKITVRSTPRMPVSWGQKQFGWTPVQITRPRDSGPMDLVLRADGYFPIHTRAYTYKNSDVIVERPTKLLDRMKLLGAKQELPPPEAGEQPETPGGTPSGAPSPDAGSQPQPKP